MCNYVSCINNYDYLMVHDTMIPQHQLQPDRAIIFQLKRNWSLRSFWFALLNGVKFVKWLLGVINLTYKRPRLKSSAFLVGYKLYVLVLMHFMTVNILKSSLYHSNIIQYT